MKIIKNFFSENKHFYLLLLLLPLLIWFKYLEATKVPEYFIYSPLDDKIPFVKEFVLPYLIWFFYIAYAIMYTGINSIREYHELLIFLGVGMAIAYTIYVFYPNAQNLRPVITQNDPLSMLVRIVYANDTPTNVCPSVHVINSIAVNSALQHTEEFSKKKVRKILSHILTISICASTVFIKQHSILDVAGGLAVAAVIYIPLYQMGKSSSKEESREAKELSKNLSKI